MNKQRSSVTSLLMLGVLSAALIYTLVFCALIYTQLGDTIELLRNQSLSEQAMIVATYLDKDQKALSNTPGSAQRTMGGGALYQYVVRDAQSQRILLHSPLADVSSFPGIDPNTSHAYFSFNAPNGPRYLGASVHYQSAAGDYVIQIAQREDSLRAYSGILGHVFLQRIALFGIPFLFLLMLVIALSIKLIMSPITKALRQAREISFAKPDVRLDESTLPQEIQPLAHAVNEALDRLEKGITAQQDFIASAAHELRTPLAVLRTHVDLLQDKAEAARMRDDVDGMSRLVSQLLDTARLESPEQLEMHPVDLAAVVKTVSQAVWPLMVKENRTFEVEGIEHPVIVEGNFDAICRALRNLLENAMHHTPKGTAIAVVLREKTIAVRDHGKGVADGDREKIFGKFSRNDRRPGEERGGGAGLGLFIVRRIMQLHGGDATVENASDGGAVFTLRFAAIET
jgi:signal transduction histidine kinase